MQNELNVVLVKRKEKTEACLLLLFICALILHLSVRNITLSIRDVIQLVALKVQQYLNTYTYYTEGFASISTYFFILIVRNSSLLPNANFNLQ